MLNLFRSGLLATATAALLGGAASAATYQLEADATFESLYGSFDLVFDDLDGDTLFSYDELLSFSGVLVGGTTFYDTLDTGVFIAGYADGSDASNWNISQSFSPFGTTEAAIFLYSYSLTELSPVPLPPALGMFGLSLAALAGLRRRRKAAET